MNIVDLVVLIIVGVSGLVGLLRGAVREIFGLAALLIGFVLALNYYGPAARALGAGISNPLVAQGAAFFGILLVAWAAFALVGMLLRRILKLLSLSWLDRLGGLAFGLARGALIVSVLTWSLAAFALPGSGLPDDALGESRVARGVLEVGDRIAALFPEDFAARLRRGVGAAGVRLAPGNGSPEQS